MKIRHITIPFFIPNLGCPNRCIFCDQGASTGIYDPPDRYYIEKKIESYLESAPDSVTAEIAFFGGSFTAIEESLQNSLLEAALPYVESGRVSGIRISTRPDCIDEKILGRLRDYRVKTIEIGAQSFNDEILRRAARGHTADQIRSASAMIKAGGFSLVIQVMTGLPGDDYAESVATAESAAALAPDAARIYPLIVIGGTPLEKMYNEKQYIPLSIDEAAVRCAGMLRVFNAHNIPVIRIGVHPFNESEALRIKAGPYHPAFGFFARSALRLDELKAAVDEFLLVNGQADIIHITIPLERKEEYIGHKKNNIFRLKEIYREIPVEYVSGQDSRLIISGRRISDEQ